MLKIIFFLRMYKNNKNLIIISFRDFFQISLGIFKKFELDIKLLLFNILYLNLGINFLLQIFFLKLVINIIAKIIKVHQHYYAYFWNIYKYVNLILNKYTILSGLNSCQQFSQLFSQNKAYNIAIRIVNLTKIVF